MCIALIESILVSNGDFAADLLAFCNDSPLFGISITFSKTFVL
jgi:hypothetical protein